MIIVQAARTGWLTALDASVRYGRQLQAAQVLPADAVLLQPCPDLMDQRVLQPREFLAPARRRPDGVHECLGSFGQRVREPPDRVEICIEITLLNCNVISMPAAGP